MKPSKASQASLYLLQIHGAAEYISGGSLSEYSYVHQCYKYNRDVSFTLVLRLINTIFGHDQIDHI